MISLIHKSCHAVFLSLERLFNQIFGNRLNPFYHLGPLTFYLFLIVFISGLYVFIFFETSVAHAYSSVESITHGWLAGIMRSLHRYASDAAVVTIYLHLFREFSRDHYRGVRWFSWFTGVPTLWLTVLLGISGYWLVWDVMAQYVAITTAEMIDWLPFAAGSMSFNFLFGQVTDRFFTLMAFLHLLGFPVGMVFLLWTHVSRISQVKFTPPMELTVGTTLALIVLSLVKPAVSHGPAALDHAPVVLNLDWFYLNIYPVVDLYGSYIAWVIPIAVTFFLLVLPWLPPKKTEPAVLVNLDHCDGCQQCARDCPFGAVSMQPRTDGKKHLFEPQVDPSLCVACGICVGACHYANPYRLPKENLAIGIDLPWLTMDEMRTRTQNLVQSMTGAEKILIFACVHGADATTVQDANTAVYVLPCSGMVPPSLLDFALKKGADGVMVSGCRMGDCRFRLGNHLIEARIEKQREPHLYNRTDRQRVSTLFASWMDQSSMVEQLTAFRSQLKTAVGKENPHGTNG